MSTVKVNVYKQNTLDYSQEGLKNHIRFIVSGVKVTGDNGTGTLYQAISDSIGLNAKGLPARGTDHPYLNGGDGLPNLKADVFHAEAVDATTVNVDVDYAVLNALTQEPSDKGDTAAALLTIASSLQSYEAIVDADGNPVLVPYIKTAPSTPGDLTIVPPASVTTALATPVNRPAKLHSQIPSMLLRFQRREQALRDGSDHVGLYNGDSCDAGDIGTFPPFTLLMTRVENVSRDEGYSWIVTYEMTFQYLLTQPSGGVNFQNPAEEPTGFSGEMSAWDVGLYYVLPNGYSSKPTSGTPPPYPVGQDMTPSDCIPTIFAVYGKDDGKFADLSLMG